MKKNNKQIYIFAHSIEPGGISGGETILIETFKRIAQFYKDVYLYTWKPGKSFYTSQGLKNVIYKVSNIPQISNFYLSFIIRTIYGVWLGLTLKITNSRNNYLYPSSDFWPDAMTAILLKIKYKKVKLLANFYLTAPNPFKGFKENGGLQLPKLNSLFYWIMQRPVYFFYKYYADFIFVTSEPDVEKFPRLKRENKYFVIRGGVNLSEIKLYKKSHKLSEKKFDGVFMGRFHPQKGVIELIEIWKEVMRERENAKLIMIGDGPLMNKVKEKIRELELENNITLTGYILDPQKKYQIFSESKIALHPAIYDSGGMAVAEAMAFGLPAISFDLLALKTYYPKGMLKAKPGNIKEYAELVVELLNNKIFYTKVQKEAVDLVYNYWSWDSRALAAYKAIEKSLNL